MEYSQDGGWLVCIKNKPGNFELLIWQNDQTPEKLSSEGRKITRGMYFSLIDPYGKTRLRRSRERRTMK